MSEQTAAPATGAREALLRWLEDLDRGALMEAGGKGANLGELVRAGLPVPPGFVVTTAAYRAVLGGGDLHARIAARLCELAPNDQVALQATSDEIRAWITAAPVPETIASAIRQAYRELSERLRPGSAAIPVAVRSSATAEDLPSASFAGQQESFLHVLGEEALLEHIRRCWASLWTPQAISYRASMNVDQTTVALAVVVQAMAPADVAGVMFTANPVTGRRDEILISASYGLGESVVSGSVTPDTFVLAPDGSVRSRTLGSKETRIVPTNAGTRVESVPVELRASFCLSAPDLAALAALARRVQAHYGAPQDTEWALSDGEIFLLQARPITTTPPQAAAPAYADEAPINKKPFAVKQLVEYWSEPPTPLDVSFLRAATGGTNELYRMVGMLPARELPQPVERPDGRIAVRFHNPRMSPAVLWRAPAQLLVAHGDPQRRWQPVADAMADAIERWRAEVQSGDAPALARLLPQQLHEFGALLARRFEAVFFVGIRPMLLTKLWARLAGGRSGAATLEDRLMRAVPFRTALQNEAVERLAQVAAAHGKDNPRFQAALERFMAEWGTRPARGMSGMPSVPTWRESAGQVLGLVDALLSDRDRPAPEEAARAQERDYQSARAEAERALWPPLRPLFRSDLAHARAGSVTREDSLFRIEAMIAAIRQTALRLGELLARDGALAAPDDVFFLLADELAPAAEGQLEVRERVERRRRGYAAVVAAHERGQHWLIATGSVSPDALADKKAGRRKRDEAGAHTLTGLAASGGFATAPVCVIRGPHEFGKMVKGAVLVAPMTAPVWTPLFRLASAVVTEIGSPVSHAAIVAREYGVPAVVAVPNATSALRDGQVVRVDGTRGVITLLEQTRAQP